MVMVSAPPVSLADGLGGENTDRLSRYRRYLAFYNGEQWDRPRRAGETRLTVNYARALVRKAASYVFPEPVTFSVPPGNGVDEAAAERAEAALNGLSADLDLHSLDFQTVIDASVLGDGCFKVTWDTARSLPMVTSVDPSGLWAWSRRDNVREPCRVAQRYRMEAGDARDLFGAAVTGDGPVWVVEDWTSERYRVEVAGALIWDGANPYGWIPYVLFPNVAQPHSLWGESDLVDLLDVCAELNQRMTVISRILQVSGNPIVVLENVAGADGIRADAGAVWELPEASRAYLLDMLQGGGVRLHLEYVDLLYRALHDLAETPRTAFGDSGRALSGTALEVEVQPLVQKVQRKRRVWDRVYRQRNARLLDLLERFGGLDAGGARRSAAVWSAILPSDREAMVRAEATLVGAGIHSRRTAMATLGAVDTEREWARVLEEGGALGDGDAR